MNRIAEFEKVSLEQFKEDWQKSVGEESAEEVYGDLKLPLRATAGSAGYDSLRRWTLRSPRRKRSSSRPASG